MAYEWIVDALDETWSSIDRTLRDRGPEVYELATPCPGWSVRDVLSHLFGFEMMLRGEPVPPHEGAWPEHVRNPIGEFNEAASRRIGLCRELRCWTFFARRRIEFTGATASAE